ncbi:metallophosphoesterase family protein [bacterium]|nr:metallophosphoesterase family protein [bacterium]
MKVAVISDIHGNWQALESVIADYQMECCERVLCLGDLAMAGPQPNEVLDYIINRAPNWTIIQGNTDKMIAEFDLKMYDKMSKEFPIMANALLDDVDIISQDKKQFLKELPPRKQLMIEGVSVLMVHGSPRRNNEDILPNMKMSEIQEIISGETDNLILCGHTHVPCGYQTLSSQTVVNVGSVGRPMTGKPFANYAIIDFDNGSFTVEHREVEYADSLAADIIRQRGFEGANDLANQLIVPVLRHF